MVGKRLKYDAEESREGEIRLSKAARRGRAPRCKRKNSKLERGAERGGGLDGPRHLAALTPRPPPTSAGSDTGIH